MSQSTNIPSDVVRDFHRNVLEWCRARLSGGEQCTRHALVFHSAKTAIPLMQAINGQHRFREAVIMTRMAHLPE